MFDAQVVDYIKKALAAGQTKEQIKTALATNGWSDAEIAENLLEAQPQAPIQKEVLQAQPQPQIQAEPQSQIQPKPQQQAQVQPTISENPAPKEEIEFQPVTQYYQQIEPEIKSQPQTQPSDDSQLKPRTDTVEENRFKIKPQVTSEPKLDLKSQPIEQPRYQPDYIPTESEKLSVSPSQSTYTYQHQEKLKPQNPKQGRVAKLFISLAVIIMIFALGGAAFIYFEPLVYIQNLIGGDIAVKTTTETGETTTTENTVISNYASYNVENTSYTASLPDYTITLSELTNLSNFETNLGTIFTDNQKTSLVNNNFFITSNYDQFYSTDTTGYASRNDDWTGLYKTIGGTSNISERAPENSIFITSDYLTHIYHKLLEQEFSYIEEMSLYPILTQLSNSLLNSASTASSANTLQQESYERISAYFLVSSAILNNAGADYVTFAQNSYINDSKADTEANILSLVDSLATENNISNNIKDLAKQEIKLIIASSKYSPSPLMGQYQGNMLEDYTQYTPRSHYTKNVILRDYFRAMMWFGRTNYLVSSTELTRDSANIALLMTEQDLQNWESIFQPTAFFVGESDDLTISDIKKATTTIGFTTADESDEAVARLQAELQTYSNPKIMSSVIISDDVLTTSKEDLLNSTKGFRFMGQRFTPDAFIFSELTQGDEAPDPETGQKLPSTPTALMVSTLMGDVVSKNLLNAWITTNAPDSDKVLANKMANLQDYFNKTSQTQWTSNIYWSWLYTIKSLFTSTENKTGYPMFMKNSDWDTKQTQTFLGSWTELKHDTLLYAKQSYAELGGGGDEAEAAAVPKGYVEPNIEFLDKLVALTNMTNEGLTKFNLIPDTFQYRNSSFSDMLKFFRRIAVSELQNETITDDDFEQLRLSAYTLDQLLQAPDSQVQLESNARSALIADVHTDVVKNQILYEADGIPNYIYVAVKDANGTRLTKGLVYSYYEFTNPLATRLTDATWQKWNYSSTIKLLKMPDWNTTLIK